MNLIDYLQKHPELFEFFQAVHLLEQSDLQSKIRFRAVPSLSFPVSEIKKIEISKTIEIFVTFMGLIGPSGVLPNHYTEEVIQRLQERDTALSDFFDVFHHRTISLFYQAWKKYRFYIDSYQFKTILSALIGQQTPSEAMLFYAGHFSRQVRSAIALENILSDHFDMPVAVKQFQGSWLVLKESEVTRLGEQPYNQLGSTAMLGKQLRSVGQKFLVCIGPVSYPEFLKLLPHQHKLNALLKLTRDYVGVEFDFAVQLILLADEVPYCQLRQRDSMQLGWNTWLKTQAFVRNAGDAVIECDF